MCLFIHLFLMLFVFRAYVFFLIYIFERISAYVILVLLFDLIFVFTCVVYIFFFVFFYDLLFYFYVRSGTNEFGSNGGAVVPSHADRGRHVSSYLSLYFF